MRREQYSVNATFTAKKLGASTLVSDVKRFDPLFVSGAKLGATTVVPDVKRFAPLFVPGVELA